MVISKQGKSPYIFYFSQNSTKSSFPSFIHSFLAVQIHGLLFSSMDYNLLSIILLLKLSQIGPLGTLLIFCIFDMFPTFLEDFSAFWHKVSQADFVLSLTSPLNQPFFSRRLQLLLVENVLCLVTQLRLTLRDPMHCSPAGSSIHGDSPGKNTRVGCRALLQGIFPIEGSNPGLLHCRQILYHLSHRGGPRILEQVAYPFSRGTSQPRN